MNGRHYPARVRAGALLAYEDGVAVKIIEWRWGVKPSLMSQWARVAGLTMRRPKRRRKRVSDILLTCFVAAIVAAALIEGGTWRGQ